MLFSSPHLSTAFTPRKQRRPYQCIICLENFYDAEHVSTGTERCDHPLCESCVKSYFNSALKNNRFQTFELISCPYSNCHEYYRVTKVLEKYFTKAEGDAWWSSAIQSKAYMPNKVTCPMEDCKAVFDVDTNDTRQCTFAQCEECNRGLCIVCQTPWHPGQIRFFEDREGLRQVLKRAKRNSWCRCPRCGQLVERESGCSHMVCCCGTYFCYHCGRETAVCRETCARWTPEQLEKARTPMFQS